MKVYVAQVWDSDTGMNTVIGVYSEAAKAQKATHDYIEEICLKPCLMDWEDCEGESIEWFHSHPDDKAMTCLVQTMTLDTMA